MYFFLCCWNICNIVDYRQTGRNRGWSIDLIPMQTISPTFFFCILLFAIVILFLSHSNQMHSINNLPAKYNIRRWIEGFLPFFVVFDLGKNNEYILKSVWVEQYMCTTNELININVGPKIWNESGQIGNFNRNDKWVSPAGHTARVRVCSKVWRVVVWLILRGYYQN